MFDDLDDSAFENVNLSHLETESAEQPPPSTRDLLGSDICKIRLPTCRGIVSRARYRKYDRKQRRKYQIHISKHHENRKKKHGDIIPIKVKQEHFMKVIIRCKRDEGMYVEDFNYT